MLTRKAALSRTCLRLFLVFTAVASDVEPATASHVRAVSRTSCRSSEGRSSTLPSRLRARASAPSGVPARNHLEPDDVVFGGLPLFHSFGQTKLPPFAQPTYFLGSSERPWSRRIRRSRPPGAGEVLRGHQQARLQRRQLILLSNPSASMCLARRGAGGSG